MRGDRCRCHAALVVDGLAEVDCLRLGIIVVCQPARYAGDLDIGDAVVGQHLAGDLRSGHAAVGPDAGVFLESALKHVLNDHAEKHDHNHKDPN